MSFTILVGHLIKVFGKNGYLKLFIEKAYYNDISNSRYLIVRKFGDDIPYFIEDLDVDNDLIKFESISTPEEARFISNCPIYLFEDDVTNKQPVEIRDSQLLRGFEVRDQKNKMIGNVFEIVEMPMQILLKVDYLGEEVLLPLHEELIIAIDMDAKVINLNITEGLLDL